MFVTDFLMYDEADIDAEGATGIGHGITLLREDGIILAQRGLTVKQTSCKQIRIPEGLL